MHSEDAYEWIDTIDDPALLATKKQSEKLAQVGASPKSETDVNAAQQPVSLTYTSDSKLCILSMNNAVDVFEQGVKSSHRFLPTSSGPNTVKCYAKAPKGIAASYVTGGLFATYSDIGIFIWNIAGIKFNSGTNTTMSPVAVKGMPFSGLAVAKWVRSKENSDIVVAMGRRNNQLALISVATPAKPCVVRVVNFPSSLYVTEYCFSPAFSGYRGEGTIMYYGGTTQGWLVRQTIEIPRGSTVEGENTTSDTAAPSPELR
eukprot:PhF_6_TR36029/c0_g1_i2/m.52229